MNFSLQDTEGNVQSPGGAPLTVVAFTCNHCPYALAWHDRLVAVAGDYRDRGVKSLFISANDAEKYPADGPEAMAERVANGEFNGFPYLYDEDQSVARSYGAKTTPDVFVLDGDLNVVYRGAPDSAYDDPSQNAAWLRAALDALIAGDTPDPASTEPVGCGIKWK